jgi:hypothetical protein
MSPCNDVVETELKTFNVDSSLLSLHGKLEKSICILISVSEICLIRNGNLR